MSEAVTAPTASEDRLREIEARLRLLEDDRAIRQLITSYPAALDSGKSRFAAGLFADGGVYDFKASEESEDGVSEGLLDQQGIVDLLEHSVHQRIIGEGAAHTHGPAFIDISGDTAVATNYSVVFRRIGMSVALYRVSANRWELVRTPGGWRVLKKVTRVLDGSAEPRDLLGQAIDD